VSRSQETAALPPATAAVCSLPLPGRAAGATVFGPRSAARSTSSAGGHSTQKGQSPIEIAGKTDVVTCCQSGHRLPPTCALGSIGMGLSKIFFAGALTVSMAGTLASFGGLGDAAMSTKHSLAAIKTSLTRSSRKDALDTNTPAADQYAAKVMICHNGHTIEINESALPAHLRNGDAIGPCSEAAGVHAARERDAAMPASITTGDGLARTGLYLGATVLTSLLLMTIGVALRRRTRPQEPDR
jgi:hypothetical protein